MNFNDAQIADILASLTLEQRQEIAKDVLQQWLRNPDSIERANLEQEALNHARKRVGNFASDDVLRRDYAYSDFLRGKKTSKQIMISEIVTQVVEHQKSVISEMLKTDPKIQEIVRVTLDNVRENFPKMIASAMTAWFCTKMDQMSRSIATAVEASENYEEIKEQISRALER